MPWREPTIIELANGVSKVWEKDIPSGLCVCNARCEHHLKGRVCERLTIDYVETVVETVVGSVKVRKFFCRDCQDRIG